MKALSFWAFVLLIVATVEAGRLEVLMKAPWGVITFAVPFGLSLAWNLWLVWHDREVKRAEAAKYRIEGKGKDLAATINKAIREGQIPPSK